MLSSQNVKSLRASVSALPRSQQSYCIKAVRLHRSQQLQSKLPPRDRRQRMQVLRRPAAGLSVIIARSPEYMVQR